MKKSNNGFAISSVLYGLLILFMLLLLSMFGILSAYKLKIDKLINDGNGARTNLNNEILNLDKTVFMINSSEKVRCESSEKNGNVSSYENQNDDYFLDTFKDDVYTNMCKPSDNCYFFAKDVTCGRVTKSFSSLLNQNMYTAECKTLVYENCEKVSEKASVDDKYKNILPYEKLIEVLQ